MIQRHDKYNSAQSFEPTSAITVFTRDIMFKRDYINCSLIVDRLYHGLL